MPGRKLRSTRKGSKDYAKIHEGSPLPDEDEHEQMSLLATSAKKMNKKQKKAAAKKQQQQKKEQSAPSSPSIFPTKDDDDIITSHDSSDVGENSDDSARSLNNINKNKPKTKTGSRYVSDDGDSDDDGDIIIRKAEEKLKKLRKKEERAKREEKLRRIQEETEQLEKSLKKKKRSKHQTTTADLRSMSAVVSKVDTLMSEKKLNFRDTSDSDIDGASNNSSGSEHGISDSGSASEEEQQIVRRREKEEKGRVKKSGKEVKLTSNIRYPQKWPHSFLKLHYVAKEKKYDDLTLAEFCAGYIAILKICKPSHKQARIDHFEELMYHATTKSWKSVLNYHAACLLEIERGNLKWGANFQLHGLQNTILTGSGANANPRGPGSSTNAKQSSQSTPGSEERVVFCKNYQRGSCNFTRDHYGHFMGENQMLRHICAKCWLAAKKQSPHSEQSDACPLSKVEF